MGTSSSPSQSPMTSIRSLHQRLEALEVPHSFRNLPLYLCLQVLAAAKLTHLSHKLLALGDLGTYLLVELLLLGCTMLSGRGPGRGARFLRRRRCIAIGKLVRQLLLLRLTVHNPPAPDELVSGVTTGLNHDLGLWLPSHAPGHVWIERHAPVGIVEVPGLGVGPTWRNKGLVLCWSWTLGWEARARREGPAQHPLLVYCELGVLHHFV
mmetsp:Transcript_6426/g.17450  ORF Transcript_6426/g.17450 Transcript_6426/m.17450 type:complete len:209 (+) Transcript_6426:189-815(+)